MMQSTDQKTLSQHLDLDLGIHAIAKHMYFFFFFFCTGWQSFEGTVFSGQFLVPYGLRCKVAGLDKIFH